MTAPLREKSGLALLYVNRLHNVMCEIYKIINGMSSEYSQLVNLKEIPYETRSVVPLDQPKIRTVLYGQRSIRYEGARLWNSLPNHFKMTFSLKDFRRIISTWNGPTCNCQAWVLCGLKVA